MESNNQSKNHYLHLVQHIHSERTIVKSFHMFAHGEHFRKIAIVNHNTIEVYNNIKQNIIYDTTYEFMCDITILQILPVKGDNTDVFFIADELGRFMFWSPEVGPLTSNNTIRAPQFLAPLYQRLSNEDKQIQFSGISANFNTLDTEATIFFTSSTKIIVIKVRWNKNKINFVAPPWEILCPYPDVIYIGLINGKDPQLGIIQQKQEKTILRIHKINSDSFDCSVYLQKPNLSSFFSSMDGEQLVTVSNCQLNIYNWKNQQIFCTFQISESGYVCSLNNELYLYVGEFASQMIVFSKKHYKNYGGFMLENFVCIKLNSHLKYEDGGFLISVVDRGHTIQFLSIYEEHWKSIRSIQSRSTIFSIQDLDGQHEILAVCGQQNNYEVGIISKSNPSKLQKQTCLKTPILALFSANNGKSLIVNTYESNIVFNYSEQLQAFEFSFQFTSGTLISIIDKLVIMQNSIYEMDLNCCTIKQIWNEKNGIISADFDGLYIGFQCQDFSYKFLNTKTNEVDRVRKSCFQQYLWKFYQPETLAVASLDQPGKLKIIPISKQPYTVNINCPEIIFDIVLHNKTLYLSFSSSVIQLYEPNGMKYIRSVASSSQPLKFIPFDNILLCYGARDAYLLEETLESVQFDPLKANNFIVYLQFIKKFAIVHQDTIALYSLQKDYPQKASNYRIISDNSDVLPSFATERNGTIFIAQSYQLIARDKQRNLLIKKQSHLLKQICCIQKMGIGLVVVGINDMESAQIIIFDYKDLQILYAEPLEKIEGANKKYPTAIKAKSQKQFFLRKQNIITLYEIKQQQEIFLKQVFSTTTSLNGYTLAIQPENSMILASDPLKYVVVSDYRLGKLVSLCRYQNLNTINDCQFIENSVVVGDAGGNISVVQFNFDKGQVQRTTMTQVGLLHLGSEVLYVVKGKKGAIYSTLSGSIGRVIGIEKNIFEVLKKIEKEQLSNLEKDKNDFRYQEWRRRFSTNDKIIDGFLIDYYLNKKKRLGQIQKWEEANNLWTQIIHKN